jgi:hypothetical protein
MVHDGGPQHQLLTHAVHFSADTFFHEGGGILSAGVLLWEELNR